jgi:hypothetical protein
MSLYLYGHEHQPRGGTNIMDALSKAIRKRDRAKAKLDKALSEYAAARDDVLRLTLSLDDYAAHDALLRGAVRSLGTGLHRIDSRTGHATAIEPGSAAV